MSQSTILVLNCGSSSIKFAAIEVATETALLSGTVSAIGEAYAEFSYVDNNQKIKKPLANCDSQQAMEAIVELLISKPALSSTIMGVGHRVVHGGEHFIESSVVNDSVLAKIRDCIPLAPLHNPANLFGIECAQVLFSELPHVAVFDTAFHQHMPKQAYLYPLPYDLYTDMNIRRYGFHGTSHRYVTLRAAALLNKPIEQANFISAHLGNGCSLAAVRSGRSIDTSMGLTPLEGLVMGTRCGDIDPGVVTFLIAQKGWSADKVDKTLNHESGLLGISGLSNDMRQLSEQAQRGNERAKLAIDMFCYRLAKYIAAFWVPLQQVDALIFTGGIGENSSIIRHQVLAQLAFLGFTMDPIRNEQQLENDEQVLTKENSQQLAIMIRTDEEMMIAQDTVNLIQKA